MVNQVKLRSYSTTTKFKSGYQVARNYTIKGNGNSKWQEAIALELQQIYKYDTFVDLGHHNSAKAPQECKKIWLYFLFDVKHDGQDKSRLVADGQLTTVPQESM
jgi:hypothetical protein